MDKVRTRFAPSPTGYMHIGNLRTALYAYLIARHNNGNFILRIEDTDQKRLVNGAMDVIYESLDAMNIKYDEGPKKGGPYGPYVQSERLSIYKKYAKKLIDLGGAHYCFCKNDDGTSQNIKDPCKLLSKKEVLKKIEDGEVPVIRQTISDDGFVEFEDEVYGKIKNEKKLLDEGVLLKSDGFPTYNFANVVDDHLMHINYVIRGNEYLSSTPKYNIIYNDFGWKIPKYIHLAPVMKDEHSKLSKRNGDASFNDLLNKGYLPEAILNYIVLLGWSPKGENEIYSLNELIKIFDVKGISKSPAIFDIEKLKWMNGVYIRNMDINHFMSLAKKYYSKWIQKNIDVYELSKIIQKRIEVLTDIPEMIDFFETLPDYRIDLYENKKMKTNFDNAKQSLIIAYKQLNQFRDWNSFEKLHDLLLSVPNKINFKTGQFLWPVRVALSGKEKTPGGAVEIAYLLGKEETLKRIKFGIKKLEGADK